MRLFFPIVILSSLFFLSNCRVRISTEDNCEEKKRNLQICLLTAINLRDADKLPATLSCQSLFKPGFGCD
ncbi:hypothetical protein AB3N62_15750 [Leptospira sp. WS4.C2]